MFYWLGFIVVFFSFSGVIGFTIFTGCTGCTDFTDCTIVPPVILGKSLESRGRE